MTHRHTQISIAAALVIGAGVACSSSTGSNAPADGTPMGGATQTPFTGSGNTMGTPQPGTGANGGNPGPFNPGGAGVPIGTPPPQGAGGSTGMIPPFGAGGVNPFPQGGAPPIGGAPPAGAGMPSAVNTGGAVNVPLPPRPMNCLKMGNANYMNPGPYKVAKKDVDLGMIAMGQHTGKFTIYYPDPLETACQHPIVAWGNGTTVTDSDFTYDFLNSAVASWGIVVASSSEDNTGSGAFHKAGIDYLLKENMTMGSQFFGKLSARAGVSGHSQGGFGANAGASHPNVVAAVVEGATFVGTTKVAGLTLTGTNDIGMGALGTVNGATGPSFVAIWEGGNHIGTETVLGYLGLDTTSGDATVSQKGSIQFQRLMSGWFRCFLAGDDAACKMFQGGAPGNCGICKDPGWNALASKNL